MTKKLLKLSFLALFCVSVHVDAQDIKRKVSDDRGHPKMIVFKENAEYRLDSPRKAFQEQLKISADHQYNKIRTINDKTGYTHNRYQQYYKNLKVEFGTYTLHGKKSKIRSMTGEFYDVKGLNMTPGISAQQAFQNAIAHVNARNYLWEYPEAAMEMDNYQKPKGDLLILPLFDYEARVMNYHLAYKFDIYATNPVSRGYLYIDAHSGDVLFYNAIIKHAGEFRNAADARINVEDHVRTTVTAKKVKETVEAMVAGTGDTRYSGTRAIDTRDEGGYYSLNDDSRQVYTRDADNQAPGFTYPYINNYSEFTDNDNNWTSAEHSANKDDAALDAHWGAMMTYDYWDQIHSRNSYDNNGAQIRSYVHVDNNYDNAFWNGSVMSYGDGSSNGNEGNGYFDALTSIDVVAHEIGHAVCTATADLAYQRESGAMNEGFSDIWGAAIEYFAKHNNTGAIPESVWLIGDEIDRRSGSAALRSMSNPNLAGDPDTYGGTYWTNPNCGTPTSGNDYCGVHSNSGVLNHWFYILVTGGSGTNDVGNSYNVSGIGMATAANIAYRLESLYLSANSTFADARSYSIQDVQNQYGAGSAEEIAVTNAWYAVGVGSEYGAPASYCNSQSSNVNDEYIGRVQLAGIDNTSGAAFYSDFTGISTALSTDTNYTITITPTWTGTVYSEGYSVWIDYNQDADFDDAGEQVFSTGPNQNTSVSGQFTVPASAASGPTRMRVSMKYNGIPTPCEAFTYGEVEDYTVDIGGGSPPPSDTTAPVISLIGSSSIALDLGDNYTEQGATATDDTDGDISGSIVIDGDVVNTNVIGIYVVTYNVSDAAGNAADEVTRTVTVSDNSPPADTTPPVITLNGSSPVDITEGDSYADAGATATDDTDGDITANIVVGGDAVNTNVVGTYMITYNVSDAAGNAANEVTRTVNVNAAGGGSTDVLHQGFFESGWDGWTDGGSDCYRYSGSRSYEGNYSIRIRDNSGTPSSMTLSGINVSSYDEIDIEFYFYSYSMENGEDFWVQYHDGSGWNTVATYARGTSFDNNAFYTATVTISNADYNFPSNAQFRFRCDASANADHIYIDQVTITGRSGGAGIAANSIMQIGGNYGFDGPGALADDNNREEDYMIYPNPVEDMLTIERMDNIPATYQILDMSGKVIRSGTLDNNPINISRLEAGIYIIRIDDGEEVVHRKMIKN